MRFFVLANVSRGGLHSLYELQVSVSLQPGAILPLLRLIELEGLLQRSPQGPRRRRKMTVTEKGEQLLQANWQHCLRPYLEPDSVLRAAAVAVLMGERRTAADYLQGIASEYERKANEASIPANKGKFSPTEWYAFMHRSWEVTRRHAAARAFRDIASELEGSEKQMT
jgi:DNA-binding PadR family transcriptional regulator